ncbi:MAG TPA: hypothetical protein VEA80_14095 [Vitreimonas sp.]|uniref:hypothetical protein n=1 Tax=Vitreimonas sp. TaxID=3069702 RepID=UPI002D45B8EE|nr:hypothetical protein [Vitreimonas sp.]HYD88601.1 hypothetical protein [Vitreimonas sp.]
MPQPQPPEGFSRDKDMERVRGRKRPADADMDATDRRADRAPDEHIDYPADVDEDEQGEPDRDTLSRSGQ